MPRVAPFSISESRGACCWRFLPKHIVYELGPAAAAAAAMYECHIPAGDKSRRQINPIASGRVSIYIPIRRSGLDVHSAHLKAGLADRAPREEEGEMEMRGENGARRRGKHQAAGVGRRGGGGEKAPVIPITLGVNWSNKSPAEASIACSCARN